MFGAESLKEKLTNLFYDYMLDFWNLLDMTVMLFWCLSVASTAQGSTISDASRDVICSITVIAIWAKILYFGRGIKSFAILLEVLKVIVKDMRSFLLLLIMFLGAFAVAFRCVKVDSETGHSFLRTFNMMFGDFSSDDFTSISDLSGYSLSLYVIYMVVVPLILLNAIIALMGDSFDKAQENARTAYLASRVKLLAEYESIGFNRIRPLLCKIGEWLEDHINLRYRLWNMIKCVWEPLKETLKRDEGTSSKASIKSNATIKNEIEENERLVDTMDDEDGDFRYVSWKVILWFLTGGVIWMEVLVLLLHFFQLCGLEERGELFIFYSETQESVADEKPGEDEWYGKLPKILSRIEKIEENQTRMNTKIDENQKELISLLKAGNR